MRPLLGILPSILLLCSCIEGEETTWLERDGSGRLEAVYKMPPLVMRSFGGPDALAEKLQSAAARDQHVSLNYVSHRTERGSVIFEFSGTFDDLRNLCTFPQRQLRDPDNPHEPVQAEALFGKTILKIDALGIAVHREVDISSIFPKNIQRSPAILGDSAFRYTLHLPVPARSTNASDISSNRQQLEWKFLLKEHATTPMVLTAEAPLPLPIWLWPVFAAVLAVVCAIALRIAKTPPSAPNKHRVIRGLFGAPGLECWCFNTALERAIHCSHETRLQAPVGSTVRIGDWQLKFAGMNPTHSTERPVPFLREWAIKLKNRP